MKFAKGRNVAITAGLCAALTIGQTIAPVSQAFALSNQVSAQERDASGEPVEFTTVNFYVGGKVVSTAAFPSGTAFAQFSSSADGAFKVPAGKVLAGWKWTGDSDKNLIPGDYKVEGESANVEAVFADAAKPVEFTTVNFYVGGKVVNTVAHNSGTDFARFRSFADPYVKVPAGKVLAGWKWTGDSDKNLIPGDYKVEGESANVEAVFADAAKPVEFTTVNFYVGGKVVSTAALPSGTDFAQFRSFADGAVELPAGKVLAGWKWTGDSDKNLIPGDYKVEGESANVEAVFADAAKPVEFTTVNFYVGGKVVSTAALPSGTTFAQFRSFADGAVELPAGKVLAGWKWTGDSDKNLIPGDYKVEGESANVEAVFADAAKPVEFTTVNFYVGGKVVSTAALPSGTDFAQFRSFADGAVELPAGKVLAGWKWTGDSDKNLIPGDYKVEGESANVEAVFADAAVDVASHAVTFHAEDGTFLQTVEYKSDQAFGLFSEGIAPEKDGYEFAGWTYGDDAHTPVKADDVVTGDWHVYASYVKKDAPVASHAVTFHAEDGTFLQTVEYKSDQAFGLFSEGIAPEKDGYEFAGWTYGDDAHTPVKADDVVTGDWHVYASYVKKDAPVASHAVTFHAEDGTFLQTVEYKSDQAFGLFSEGIAPEKDGYEFAGWTYGDDAHTPVKADDVVTGDWHVYASYVKKDAPVASHAVTFHAEDGTFLQTVEYKSDQAFGLFSEGIAPEKDGYEFAGWTYGDDAHTPVKADDVVTGDWHVYASYVKKDAPVASHAVTFHAEDGTFLQTVEYKSDQAFGLFSEGIAPEKDGYEFAGWTYGDDAHTPVKADDVVTGDWHVYASYVKKDAPQAKVFKVTFWDGLTWTEDAVVEVEEGKTVAAPTDPACEGFKFEGWFVDKALKEAYDFSAPVNGDMVLYAKWSKTAEAPKDEQKPVTPSDKNAGLPQTGDASMVAMGFAAASGAVLSAAGYFSSKRRKH